ncbi:MAG: hypothetical protein ACRDI2_07160, partial [Chloroflexota bacterium]
MAEQALHPASPDHLAPVAQPRRWLAAASARLARHWPWYVAGVIFVAYLLLFVRGLGWQWASIVVATEATPPTADLRPVIPAPRHTVGAPGGAGSAAPVSRPAPAPLAREPLPPTDEPPPRDATDTYGVYYDAQGVAVIGIDADPSGV